MSSTIPEFPVLLAEAARLGDEFAVTAAHHDATGEFPFGNFYTRPACSASSRRASMAA